MTFQGRRHPMKVLDFIVFSDCVLEVVLNKLVKYSIQLNIQDEHEPETSKHIQEHIAS